MGGPEAVFGYLGSEKAANAQEEAAKRATDIQSQMYYQSRQDQSPWQEAGKESINALAGGPIISESAPTREQFVQTWANAIGRALKPSEKAYVDTEYDRAISNNFVTGYDKGLLAKGPGEFKPEEEPGYKFGYQEFVEKPTLRTAAATGLSQSGRTLKSLSRYASDYASTKYDNFLDRYYKSLDPYFRMAGLGSNVTVSGGNQAIATGQGMAQTTLEGGQARASGYINKANVLGNQFTNFNRNALDMYAMNSNPSGSWGGWGSTSAGSAAGADSMMWL